MRKSFACFLSALGLLALAPSSQAQFRGRPLQTPRPAPVQTPRPVQSYQPRPAPTLRSIQQHTPAPTLRSIQSGQVVRSTPGGRQGVQVRHQDHNNAVVSGQSRNRDGAGYSGYVGKKDGVVVAGGEKHDRSGGRRGGDVRYKDNNNFVLGGHNYDKAGNGKSGYVGKQDGKVIVGGEVRRPGFVPGTQDRFGGDAKLAGRDSTLKGRHETYDPTGKVKLAATNGHLDRRGYNQTQEGGLGGFKGKKTTDVKFGGTNTRLGHKEEYNAGGLAKAGYGGSVSRHGAKGEASAKVGGVKVKAEVKVDGKGVRGKVDAPKVKVPVKAPKVDVPANVPGGNAVQGVGKSLGL